MVRIHVKVAGVEEQQFLYDCNCRSSVAAAADAILEIYNLQAWIHALSVHVRHRLLSDDFKGRFPDAELALDRTLSEAEAYSSKEQVLHHRVLSPLLLRDHIRLIEDEIKLAQSRGLISSNVALKTFNPELHRDAQLIWAGKELSRGKKLCEYVGDNEKTKITIELKIGFEDAGKTIFVKD